MVHGNHTNKGKPRRPTEPCRSLYGAQQPHKKRKALPRPERHAAIKRKEAAYLRRLLRSSAFVEAGNAEWGLCAFAHTRAAVLSNATLRLCSPGRGTQLKSQRGGSPVEDYGNYTLRRAELLINAYERHFTVPFHNLQYRLEYEEYQST
ncbi:hypothetical protein NDU88_003122 [Pleurodeles waltl]|uniref:Uncharacterized protein n=1 Tax=Pleurodeles waltl TaxID=8319 RepID=A0AAV7KTZ3_PLEWA|nr:hypothetical protein NDU88_003122 [Pleurodeles waltl]